METIQKELHEIEIYTVDQAVNIINRGLRASFTRRDLYKAAESGIWPVFCLVRRAPIIKTEWGYEIKDKKGRVIELDAPTQIISELALLTDFSLVPPEHIEALARGMEPPALKEIELPREETGSVYPVANLDLCVESYCPELKECGFDVGIETTIDYLNQALAGIGKEYVGAMGTGEVTTTEEDYWFSGESLELYIFRESGQHFSAKELLYRGDAGAGSNQEPPTIIQISNISNEQYHLQATQVNHYQQTDHIYHPPQNDNPAKPEAAPAKKPDKPTAPKKKRGRPTKFPEETYKAWCAEWERSGSRLPLSRFIFREAKGGLSEKQCQRIAKKYDKNKTPERHN